MSCACKCPETEGDRKTQRKRGGVDGQLLHGRASGGKYKYIKAAFAAVIL